MTRPTFILACVAALIATQAPAQAAKAQVGAPPVAAAVTERPDVAAMMDQIVALLPAGRDVVIGEDGSAGALLDLPALEALITAADTIAPELAKIMVVNPDLTIQVSPVATDADGAVAKAGEMGATVVDAFKLFGIPPGQVRLADGRAAAPSETDIAEGWALDFRVAVQ